MPLVYHFFHSLHKPFLEPALGIELQDYVPTIRGDDALIPAGYEALKELLGFKEKPYDPRESHDKVRARVSYILLTFLGIVLVFSFLILGITFFLPDQATAWGNAKDLLQVVIPTLTTLVGSVVGFYFGSQAQKPG